MYEKFFRCVALLIYQNFHTKTILTSALSNNVKGKFWGDWISSKMHSA